MTFVREKVKPPEKGGFLVLETQYSGLRTGYALTTLPLFKHWAQFGDVVGVADVVSRLRLLAADSADLCHYFYLLRSNSEGLTAKGNFGAWCVKH